MNTSSSVTHRILSSRFVRALAGLGLVAAALTAGTPTAQASYGEGASSVLVSHIGDTVSVCHADEVFVRLDPTTGTVEFGVAATDGSIDFLDATTLELAFGNLAEVQLRVSIVGTDGIIELSPDGLATQLYTTWRKQTTIPLDAESTAGEWDRDYLMVPLDTDGQELPAVPKVTVKTKKTCPIAPIIYPGDGDE